MFRFTDDLLFALDKWIDKRNIRKHYDKLDDREAARQMSEAQQCGDVSEWEWREIFDD